MLRWSITFLVIGLVAGLLGLSGIARRSNPHRVDSVCCLSSPFLD